MNGEKEEARKEIRVNQEENEGIETVKITRKIRKSGAGTSVKRSRLGFQEDAKCE